MHFFHDLVVVHKASTALLLSTKTKLKWVLAESHHSLLQNIYFTRFLKGLFHTNPPPAKLPPATWDMQQVLNHLNNMPSNPHLSLILLAQKTVMLLLLSTMRRKQEIRGLSIHPKHMKVHPDKIEFILQELPKTFALNHQRNALRIFTVMRFPSNNKLCPYAAVLHYIRRTSNIRGQIQRLFITCTDHKPISEMTLRRWILTVMDASGIDTKKFIAYSTRHASSSYAYKHGMAVNTILNLAGWSNPSSFVKFYLRPIEHFPTQVRFGQPPLATKPYLTKKVNLARARRREKWIRDKLVEQQVQNLSSPPTLQSSQNPVTLPSDCTDPLHLSQDSTVQSDAHPLSDSLDTLPYGDTSLHDFSTASSMSPFHPLDASSPPRISLLPPIVTPSTTPQMTSTTVTKATVPQKNSATATRATVPSSLPVNTPSQTTTTSTPLTKIRVVHYPISSSQPPIFKVPHVTTPRSGSARSKPTIKEKTTRSISTEPTTFTHNIFANIPGFTWPHNLKLSQLQFTRSRRRIVPQDMKAQVERATQQELKEAVLLSTSQFRSSPVVPLSLTDIVFIAENELTYLKHLQLYVLVSITGPIPYPAIGINILFNQYVDSGHVLVCQRHDTPAYGTRAQAVTALFVSKE